MTEVAQHVELTRAEIDRMELENNNPTLRPPPPLPPGYTEQPPEPPMTKERFTKIHGPCVQLGGSRVFGCKDGATMSHNGFHPTFHQPPVNDIERWQLKYRFRREMLKRAEHALRFFEADRLRQFRPVQGFVFQFGQGFQWNADDLGEPPLNKSGVIDADAALEYLRVLVATRRYSLERAKARLIAWNIPVEDRDIVP